MGIGDSLRGMANNAQESVKSTTASFLHFLLRFATGVLLGLTIALIGQELIAYGTLSLLFVMVVVTAAVLKTLAKFTISQILIFDLICVLVAMLLRMYILVAP